MPNRTISQYIAATLLAASCALATVAESKAEEKFSKGSLSFTYPSSGWTMEEIPADGTDVAVRFTSTSVPDLQMYVRYTASMPKRVHEESVSAGGARTFVYGNGLAENYAKETGATAYPSVGLVNFFDETDVSAHFTLVKPGESKVWTIDAFTHVYPDIEGTAIMGFIKAAPPADHAKLDTERFGAMQDLYDIVQSIEVAKAGNAIRAKIN